MSSLAWLSNRTAVDFTFRELTVHGSAIRCRWTTTRIWLSAEKPSAVVESAEADDKSSRTELTEHEPNNLAAAANAISANSMTSGVISAAAQAAKADADLYRFHAKKGEKLVLEINAARNKSPLDSKLEVLDAAGKPIPRVVLQAVRSSYFTFRGHNSTDRNDFRMHGAGDMELNEYVYANGEVMKLWMYPRGPDSGFLVYPGFSWRSFHLLRHDRHCACAERDVLHRRAASARTKRSSPTVCRNTRCTTKTTTTGGESWAAIPASRSPRRQMATTWFACRTCAVWAAMPTSINSSCGRRGRISP